MKHRIALKADPADFVRVIDHVFAKNKDRFAHHQPMLSWEDSCYACGFSVVVAGMKICGRLALVPTGIELQADVPWPLRPLVGSTLPLIDSKFKRLFLASA
jgi:hypothetical protein